MAKRKPRTWRWVYKSAITGRIVKASTARRWPHKTIAQRVRIKRRAK